MSDKPLRILVIVNLPWDARLGAIRVWVELAEQWRAAGHVVEKFSLSGNVLVKPFQHRLATCFQARVFFIDFEVFLLKELIVKASAIVAAGRLEPAAFQFRQAEQP